MSETKSVHSNFWVNFFNIPSEEDDLRKSLHSIPLFKELNRRDLSSLIKIIHNRTFVANEFIFYRGDPGIGLYIIREGEVEVQRENSAGKINILAAYTKGDFFGELALVEGEKRSASAIAKSECKVSVIFKPDLDEFIEKYPKKGIKILTGISNILALRLRVLNEDYFNLQFNLQNEKGI
ncbi:MAG: cyclic nucleotide-binding domain-containing protein [Ignavibacteriaceae bacterium]